MVANTVKTVRMQDIYVESGSLWRFPSVVPAHCPGLEMFPHLVSQVLRVDGVELGYCSSADPAYSRGEMLRALELDGLRQAANATRKLPLQYLQQLPADVVQKQWPAMSHTKPGYIRYLASPEHLKDDRWTITKAGRYVARHCPWLSPEEVKQLTAVLVGCAVKYELRFTAAGDRDAIRTVYEDGPSSCMSGRNNHKHAAIIVQGEQVHPAEVYGHPSNSLRLAYLVTDTGSIAARVWTNCDTKTYSQVYAATDTLESAAEYIAEALKDLGYRQARETTMRGERLLRLDTDCGAIVCPYIDPSNLGVEVHGDHLVAGGPCTANYETGCLSDYDLENRSRCEDCGDLCHEDDMTYVEDHGDVCQSCLDDNYRWAIIGGRVHLHGGWVHEDACQRVHGDVSWDYIADRAMGHSAHDFVEVSCGDSEGELWHIDEVTVCESGEVWRTEDMLSRGLTMCQHCGYVVTSGCDSCENCDATNY